MQNSFKMKNYDFSKVVFLILLPLLMFMGNIGSELYLYVLLYSIFSVYFIQYLFIKTIGDKKSASLIVYGFLFQFMVIIFIYLNAINAGNGIDPYITSDAGGYYRYAVELANSDDFLQTLREIRINYIGYPMFLGIFYKVLYPNLLLGLLLNVSIGLLNAYLAAKIAYFATGNKKVVFYTTLFFLISPQMTAASTYLLKDVFIINSFLVLLLATLLFNRSNYMLSFFYLLYAITIIGLFRLTVLPMFLAFAYYISVKKLGIKQIILLLFLILIFFVGYSQTKSFSSGHGLEGGLSMMLTTADAFAGRMGFSKGGVSFTEHLVAGFNSWPLYKRIIFIPVFSLVQYLTPINFWSFGHEIPWSYVRINLQVVWLFFLGMITIFALLNYKKIANIFIKKLLLSALIGFILIAFMYGGTLPRYAYPFYAIFLISSAYIYNEVKEDTSLRKNYRAYRHLYFGLMVVMSVIYIVIKIIV